MKRAELAAVLGVSVRRVAQLEAEGIVRATRRGKAGRASLFDLRIVVPKYIAHLEATAAGDGNSAEAERVALTRVRRRQLELDLARAEGSLVRCDDVLKAFKALGTGASARFMELPPRARAEGLIDSVGEARLRKMCREILDTISRWDSVAAAARGGEARRGGRRSATAEVSR